MNDDNNLVQLNRLADIEEAIHATSHRLDERLKSIEADLERIVEALWAIRDEIKK